MWWQKIIFLLLFMILGLNISPGACYLITFVILFIAINYILCGNTKIRHFTKIDFIPLIMLLIWFYGLIIGYINGNKYEYIIANFAGMFCYVIYYVLLLINISDERIIKLLQWASLSISIICCIYFILDSIGIDTNPLEIVLGGVNRGSSTGQSRVYFTGLTVAYSSWVALLFEVLSGNKNCMINYSHRWKRFLGFALFTFSLFFATASKGFMLGGICLFAIILFELYGKKLMQGKLTTSMMSGMIVLLILVVVLINLKYSNIITNMFDSNDESNEVRYLQLLYILDDINLSGRGLGAIIPNYSRDVNAEYGFELSYINLIHKFGIFAIVLFLSWGYIFIKSVKNIFKRVNLSNSLFALGCMGYLFPSVGNPLVMHPACVILNCLSIYLLRKKI